MGDGGRSSGRRNSSGRSDWRRRGFVEDVFGCGVESHERPLYRSHVQAVLHGFGHRCVQVSDEIGGGTGFG